LIDHPKIIREFKEIASLVRETRQSASDDDSLNLVLAMILQQPMPSPFGIWHGCSTVKVTCWQSTNSSLSESKLTFTKSKPGERQKKALMRSWKLKEIRL
jgi:hypothetical protein